MATLTMKPADAPDFRVQAVQHRISEMITTSVARTEMIRRLERAACSSMYRFADERPADGKDRQRHIYYWRGLSLLK
jgi:hypothetical protein